jgi:phosphoesterase RecJ-like protein
MEHLKLRFQKANAKIESAKNILIITHFNPDGDGLSSACAMAEYAKLLDKKYTLFCYTEPPRTFSFLTHIDEFRFIESIDGEIKKELPIDFSSYDLIIVLDCGSLSRTKIGEYISNRNSWQYLVEFDHHPKVDDYADLEIREPLTAATAELVYHFFKANRIKLNKTLANTLITGVITDTANFLYPQTSEKTVSAASELVRLGAQLPRITDNTLRNKSIEAMQLWGRIMASLTINPKYNIAITVLPKEAFANGTINKEELEGVSGFISNLKGVSAILFLREEGDGLLRGSLRTSHPKVDVSKLAHLLGGGGHAKASGFSIKGQLRPKGDGWQII